MSIDCNQNQPGAMQALAECIVVQRSPRASAIEWGGLAVLALPTALLGLDVTLLYLAVPALAADLRATSVQTLWIMDAYGFMIAGFLISMGALGDRIGRRRLLMFGAVAFALASVLAAYSTSANMLIAARAILGVAGATLMPSTLALISNMFLNARERALAIGVWATMFALGMAAGPLVGGMLLEYYGWGAAFLVAPPIVGIVLIAAPLVLPEYRAPASGRFDLFSVALSLGAILPAVYFVKESAKNGFSLESVLMLLFGIVCGVAFVRRQRVLSSPLLDVQLFAKSTFTAALSILLVGLVGVGGAMLLVTQYLQLVVELPPMTAGLLMGPPALMMLVAGITAPLLAQRTDPGFVMAGALSLAGLGYLLLALLAWLPSVALVATGFALVYLGLGTIAALGTDLVVASAPPEKAGSAAAMSETVQELGIAVGVATLGSLTTAIYRQQIVAEIPDSLPQGVSAAVADSLAATFSVLDRLPGDVLAQSKAAFLSGLSVSAVAAGLATIALAAVSATTLRGIGLVGTKGP